MSNTGASPTLAQRLRSYADGERGNGGVRIFPSALIEAATAIEQLTAERDALRLKVAARGVVISEVAEERDALKTDIEKAMRIACEKIGALTVERDALRKALA